MTPAEAAAEIKRRYGGKGKTGVWAFCRQHELPVTTVSQVLRGGYVGNVARQMERITRALAKRTLRERVEEALVGVYCAPCDGKGEGGEACGFCKPHLTQMIDAVLWAAGGDDVPER